MAKNLVGDLFGVQIGIYRSLIAALFALPIILICKTRLDLPNISQIKSLFITSIGIIYEFPILTAVGMEYVPISHGGVVLASLPIFTSLFARIITKQKQSTTFWIFALMGFFIVFSLVILVMLMENYNFILEILLL